MMDNKIFAHQNKTENRMNKGILKDISILVQTNLSVKDFPTEADSQALKKYIALEDASVVKYLKENGGFIAGSTHMGELGFGIVGDTASMALKENKCDAALITDTFGEARYIAAESNHIGYKPSYGIISRLGLIGIIPSMECISIISKSFDIIKKIMSVICIPDKNDFSMLQENLPDFNKPVSDSHSVKTIGFLKEIIEALDDEEKMAIEKALAEIKSKGIIIKELSFPDHDLFRAVHNIVGSAEASSACGKYDSVRYGHRTAQSDNWNDMYLKSRSECFGTLIKSYLFQGAYFQFQKYEAFEDACRIRRKLLSKMNEFFAEVDLIAIPARLKKFDASKTKKVSDIYDAFSLTINANVTGFPAVSIPGYALGNNFDFGLQLIAPHLSDTKLLTFIETLTSSKKGNN